MTQLFTNNAASELASAAALGDLTLTLKTGDGAKFPTPAGGDYFLVTVYQRASQSEVNHEIIRCTARSGDVLTVARAQEGTTARAFLATDPVELRLTAGTMTAKQDVGDGVVSVVGVPPSNPKQGQEWANTEDGIKYTWVNDGDSGQWVELGPGGSGPPGTQGNTGLAATVAVGTVTALASGAAPTVANSGTSSAAVLNFGFPAPAAPVNGTAATVAIGTTTALASTAAPTVSNSGSSAAAVLNFGIPTPLAQPPAAVVGDNTVATTETLVARFALPANFLTTGDYFKLAFMGQVSGTATLIFRVRVGTAGSIADALAGQFATSAAGAANANVAGDIHLHMLSATTIHAGGFIQLINSAIGKATGAFAAATVAPASALFVSVTLVQSLVQTYTSRSAVLTKVR